MIDEFIGTRPDAVIELLRHRRERLGSAGARADGRKLALIVEGGGMRGVLSAGSLLALDLLGYGECFDEIYATSAGAVNAAYFLSGQGRLGITVYFDSISNRRFYNPFRLHKIVDVGFVYDQVVPREKTLDEAKIRASATDLFLAVTDVVKGTSVLLDVKDCDEPIAAMLKASSALPVVYNRTVTIGGREFVDGGMTCAFPVEEAVSRGCTDILILLTKTRGYEPRPPTVFGQLLLYVMMGRRFPALMDAYRRLPAETRKARRIAVGAVEISGVNVATICPNEAELIVQRTTIDRRRLIQGAYLLARKTCHLLGEGADQIEKIFHGYRGPLTVR